MLVSNTWVALGVFILCGCFKTGCVPRIHWCAHNWQLMLYPLIIYYYVLTETGNELDFK